MPSARVREPDRSERQGYQESHAARANSGLDCGAAIAASASEAATARATDGA